MPNTYSEFFQTINERAIVLFAFLNTLLRNSILGSFGRRREEKFALTVLARLKSIKTVWCAHQR